MGSTNKTTNYELSQYIGTDKPSWLNDYNNDMLKIDTQMKANATAASGAQTTANTADGKADANALAISTLDTQINTPSTGLAAVVAGHTTSIGTINGTIGTTPLTTVAQTITGAIEEVKSSVPSITGLMKYLGNKSLSVSYDGTKTISDVLSELYTALTTYLSGKGSNYRFMLTEVNVGGSYVSQFTTSRIFDNTFASRIRAESVNLPNLYEVTMYGAGSTFKVIDLTSGTITDNSATVPTTDSAVIMFAEFEIQ